MLKIYNTLTNQKDTFVPIEEGKVKMYVCGMTVYDYCHLGHARVMVVFDVVVSYLRSLGYDVTYVRNITDIDDKIIRRANENGEDFHALTERFIDIMNEDADALGVVRPDLEPKASESMDDILAMIGTLIDNGHAYQGDNGDVYYDVSRFETYGRLSGKNTADLKAGAWMNPNMIHLISCYGSAQNPASQAGILPGVQGGPAGTSSVRPCRRATSAHILIFMVAVWTSSFLTMKTRSPSPRRPLVNRS
jgi:hypothetical protein